MSVTRDLLEGLRGELSAAGVTTSVFFKLLPTSPDRAIALAAYGTSDEATVASGTQRVQFWFRGDVNASLSPDDDADGVFNVLHGLTDRTYGSVHLVQMFRVSSVPLGIDGSKRSERTDNYEALLDLPVTAARPF